jgi:outer membrane lipase/esterase
LQTVRYSDSLEARSEEHQIKMGEDMKTKIKAVAAAVALTCSAASWAEGFSNVYFFGDSLTDAGTIPATFPSGTLPAGTGRFTTNPGPVWAEVLAAYFGTSATPAAAGGTNYAWGGARVVGSPGVPDSSLVTNLAMPIATQVSTYLAVNGGKADPNALYAVWGGANDIFVIAPAAASDPAGAQAYLTTTANSLVAQVAALKAAGAKYVIVPNLPDIGLTPFGASQGLAGAAGLTQLSAGYNQLVGLGLGGAGLAVIPVDTFSLLRDVTNNPAKYGFANASVPACTTASSLICTSSTLVAANAQKDYVFADGVHPTTAAHALFASYVEGLLIAPSQISLLAESSVKTRRNLIGTINDQSTASAWARNGTYNFWLSAGSGDLKFDRNSDFQGAKGRPDNVTVGIDASVAPGLVLGGALTWSTFKPDFSNGGSFHQEETVLSIYSTYASGPLRLNAVGSLGTTTYDTRRDVQLGAFTLAVPGNTKGSNVSLSLIGSYELGSGVFRHGPTIGVEVQSIRVNSFAESNPLSAGLTYGEQKRNSSIASLGYRFSYDAGSFLPFARLSIDHELATGHRDINVAYQSQPGPTVAFAAATPERTFANLSGGVVVKLASNVTGNAVVSVLAGQSNVRSYGVQLGLNIGF